MNCCRPKTLQSSSSKTSTSPSKMVVPPPRPREEIILHIPNSTIHLMEGGEAIQLAQGGFTLLRLVEDGTVLTTLIKVGGDLSWPLTKDEPVVKVDELHYLFSLPSEEGRVLTYGVSFVEPSPSLASLDLFLGANCCLSSPPEASLPRQAATGTTNTAVQSEYSGLYWREFAPRLEDYNGVVAKAIAGGTGEVVKGIFKCSNAYVKQVQKGGDMIRNWVPMDKNNGSANRITNGTQPSSEKKKKTGVQKSLKRVRKLSKMTEKMSRTLLDGVAFTSGSVTGPLVRSQAGKRFLAMLPGEVLLASLDAINKVLDAVEAVERDALSATSTTVAGVVSHRFGENAGEITEDVFATAGHAAGTAWNIFKIRKAINPASSLPSSILKNCGKEGKN